MQFEAICCLSARANGRKVIERYKVSAAGACVSVCGDGAEVRTASWESHITLYWLVKRLVPGVALTPLLFT